MNNPFETIDERLSRIEILMLHHKHQPQTVVQQNETEQHLIVQEAGQFLNRTVPTIYSKVSKG